MLLFVRSVTALDWTGVLLNLGACASSKLSCCSLDRFFCLRLTAACVTNIERSTPRGLFCQSRKINSSVVTFFERPLLGRVRLGSIRNKNNWNNASKRLFPFRLFYSQEQNSRNIFRNKFLFRNIPNERALSSTHPTSTPIGMCTC